MAGIVQGVGGSAEVGEAAGGSSDKDRRGRGVLPDLFDQGSDREVPAGCV